MALYDSRGDRAGRLIRRLVALTVVTTVTVVTGVWLFAPPAPLAARFPASACEVVALRDTRDGRAVVGAEALALTPDDRRLVLTAYDRRGGPGAAGGLYSVSPFSLGAGGQVAADPLHTGQPGAPFRPHGLALTTDGRRLALINRTGPGEARVEIGPLGPDGWSPARIVHGSELCRANGLDFGGAETGDLLITLDRADCAPSLRDLLPGARTGRIARTDGMRLEIVETGLQFPNGVLGPYVAETRAGRISRHGADPIALPGGPDNLWQGPDGRLIVAVHPRLHILALYLGGWLDWAPSRIVAADPTTGAVEVLFDDPSGEIFPAATAAVISGGMLIAGSVGAPGLLVCLEGSR